MFQENQKSNKSPKILLVGCGKMGEAMLKGWLKNIDPKNIAVVEPDPTSRKRIEKEYGIKIISTEGLSLFNIAPFLEFDASIIVFAIKPQEMEGALKIYNKYHLLKQNSIFVSIAAGKDIEFLESKLGDDAKIVRAMPNLPAAYNQGFTALCKNKNVNVFDFSVVGEVFSILGEIGKVDDEKMMDAITAASGSGPAYYFLFLDSFIKACVKLGIKEDLAVKLSKQTLFGSSFMAKDSKKSAEQLKNDVTSPGGTTEAALKTLEAKGGIKDLMEQAFSSAAKRSKELSKK